MSKEYPMSISIVGGADPQKYKITNRDGGEIKGVRSIDFHVEVDQLPIATINFICPEMSLWEVSAQVPLEQLITIAKAHGFLLIPETEPQAQMNYSQLRDIVRGHGYELIKTDSPDGFYEEP